MIKKLKYVSFYLLGLGMLSAAPRTVERVLKDATTMVALELTPQTVFCTALGYGAVQLKVNVPELDYLAHFDHRVVGEGLPCITAGDCSEDLKPTTILNNEKIAAVPMRVILSEQLVIDDQAGTCTQQLSETVISHIRGHDFRHFRGGDLKSLPIEKCLKIQHL